MPVSGIVGMGFTSTPNFLDLAYQAKEISSPVFALALSNLPEQSTLYFDGIP